MDSCSSSIKAFASLAWHGQKMQHLGRKLRFWSPPLLSHEHHASSPDCTSLGNAERASQSYKLTFLTAFPSPFSCSLEMKRILEKFKETEQWIEKSVLIGCSDEHVPHFALDLGWDDSSSICVGITFDALRWRCCWGSVPSPCWVIIYCQEDSVDPL